MSSKRYKSVIGRSNLFEDNAITSIINATVYPLDVFNTSGTSFSGTNNRIGSESQGCICFPIVNPDVGDIYRIHLDVSGISGPWKLSTHIDTEGLSDENNIIDPLTNGPHTIDFEITTTDDKYFGFMSGNFGSIVVSNMYAHRFISTETPELLSVSGSSGVPIDRWGATLTTTAVTSFKDGDIRAMYFDGLANTDIVLGTTYTLPLAGSTIQVWFKTDPDFVSGDRWLLGYNSGGQSYLGFGATGDLELESDTGGDFCLDYAEANIIPHKWYHLVVIADGGTVKSYLNDVLIETSTPTDDVTFQYIGNYSAGNRPYWGQIGSVRLWDGALTVAEASQLHSAEKKWYGL